MRSSLSQCMVFALLSTCICTNAWAEGILAKQIKGYKGDGILENTSWWFYLKKIPGYRLHLFSGQLAGFTSRRFKIAGLPRIPNNYLIFYITLAARPSAEQVEIKDLTGSLLISVLDEKNRIICKESIFLADLGWDPAKKRHGKSIVLLTDPKPAAVLETVWRDLNTSNDWSGELTLICGGSK